MEWIKSNYKKVLIKWIPGLLGFTYIWSILFKLIIGQNKDIHFTAPWYALEHTYYNYPYIPLQIWLSFGISVLFILGLAISGIRKKQLSTLHGDAHWATEDEIVEMGLRSKRGILVGKKRGKFLCAEGTEHVLCYAPSRSKKGVGIVIPNLLNWEGSVICLDIKRENFDITSGFRSQHSSVYLWDPTNQDGHTVSFNPFSFIDKNNKITRIDELDKLASILLPDNEKKDIWQPAARELFLGIALYLIDQEKYAFTIGAILRLIREDKDFISLIEAVVADENLDPLSKRNLNGFLQKAEKEKSGVLSTLTTALNLWNNPIIDAATTKSDFDIRDLRKKRMSIYVAVQPDDLTRLSPLITLFFQQVLSAMTRNLPGEKEPHKVLMLLDEFTSLSKMPVLEKGIGFFAGYNVRLMPIIQGISQLESEYGTIQARSFQQNCKIKIAYAQNDEVAAAQISRTLGNKTIKSFSHSRSIKGGGGSNTQSYIKRELLLPNEVMQLDNKIEIVMVEASPPVKARKIIYYKDRAFKKRLLPAAPRPKIDLEEFIKEINSKTPPSNKIEHKENSTEKEETEALEIIGVCDVCGMDSPWPERINQKCLTPDNSEDGFCNGIIREVNTSTGEIKEEVNQEPVKAQPKQKRNKNVYAVCNICGRKTKTLDEFNEECLKPDSETGLMCEGIMREVNTSIGEISETSETQQ